MHKYNPDKHFLYVITNMTDTDQQINIFSDELPKDVTITHDINGYFGKPIPFEKNNYLIKTVRKLCANKPMLFLPVKYKCEKDSILLEFSPTVFGWQPHECAVEFPFDAYITKNSELWVEVYRYSNISLLLTEE